MNTNFHLSSRKVSPQELFLDLRNPRFCGDRKAPSFHPEHPIDDIRAQEITRRYLLRSQGASSLVESIQRLGFLSLDRIVVNRFSENRYIIVEGNRRVAAIKTLIGDVTRHALSLPTNIYSSLVVLEVLELHTNEDCQGNIPLLIQGLRHISGVRNWGPFQQGQLIDLLVNTKKMNFRDAALSVGLSPARVSTILKAYFGLRQMLDDPKFGSITGVNHFSYFEQAYLRIPVREWLMWDENQKKYTNTQALQQFYSCITTNDAKCPPRLLARQVRDLLPMVLNNNEARHAFFDNMASITEAFAISCGNTLRKVTISEKVDEMLRYMRSTTAHIGDLKSEDLASISHLHQLAGNILRLSGQA